MSLQRPSEAQPTHLRPPGSSLGLGLTILPFSFFKNHCWLLGAAQAGLCHEGHALLLTHSAQYPEQSFLGSGWVGLGTPTGSCPVTKTAGAAARLPEEQPVTRGPISLQVVQASLQSLSPPSSSSQAQALSSMLKSTESSQQLSRGPTLSSLTQTRTQQLLLSASAPKSSQ